MQKADAGAQSETDERGFRSSVRSLCTQRRRVGGRSSGIAAAHPQRLRAAGSVYGRAGRAEHAGRTGRAEHTSGTSRPEHTSRTSRPECPGDTERPGSTGGADHSGCAHCHQRRTRRRRCSRDGDRAGHDPARSDTELRHDLEWHRGGGGRHGLGRRPRLGRELEAHRSVEIDGWRDACTERRRNRSLPQPATHGHRGEGEHLRPLLAHSSVDGSRRRGRRRHGGSTLGRRGRPAHAGTSAERPDEFDRKRAQRRKLDVYGLRAACRSPDRSFVAGYPAVGPKATARTGPRSVASVCLLAGAPRLDPVRSCLSAPGPARLGADRSSGNRRRKGDQSQ
jgi:hypothetical protein